MENSIQLLNYEPQATGKSFFHKFYELEIYKGALSRNSKI